MSEGKVRLKAWRSKNWINIELDGEVLQVCPACLKALHRREGCAELA